MSRGHGHLHHQFTHIEAVCRERFPQLLGPVHAVGPHRLLHQVVEQLLDERGVNLLAFRQELRQLRAPANFAVSPARVS